MSKGKKLLGRLLKVIDEETSTWDKNMKSSIIFDQLDKIVFLTILQLAEDTEKNPKELIDIFSWKLGILNGESA
jgi:hypothetical protein